MAWFSLENLLTAIFCTILACFIARYAENKAHHIWALFNVAVAIWAWGAYYSSTVKDPQQALFYWKIAYIGVSFIPALLYHFICAYYSRERNPIIIISLYFYAIIFSCIDIFTNVFLKNIHLIFNDFYYVYNPTLCYNIFWISWNFIIFLSFCTFKAHLKNNSNNIPSQIIFWSLLIGFIGGVSTALPVYGIMIYPGYHISICIYVLLIAYGIFYHRLLPIDVVIKRSILYSLLVAGISLAYLLSVLISQQFFQEHFGFSSTIISSIFIAIAFIPLRNKIQDFVDRLFLKATPIEIAYQNEKLKNVAILASGLAHEIKNPLTTLKTFTSYVPQKKDDAKFMEQYQRLIPQEIDRIDNLVRELLVFAKPSPPQIQTIYPNETINNILSMLTERLTALNIRIELQLNAKTPIQADPNQLKQALLNLILNAMDVMPDGGKLKISTYLSNLDTASSQYIIEISDTGCGIDPKDLPHIFEPFFSKKEKGTGLGLAITHGIIEKHGGRISVQSESGKGTRFIISFNQ